MPSAHPCEQSLSPQDGADRARTSATNQWPLPAGRQAGRAARLPTNPYVRADDPACFAHATDRRPSIRLPLAPRHMHTHDDGPISLTHSMVLLGSSYASARQAATVLPAGPPLGYGRAGVLARPNHACHATDVPPASPSCGGDRSSMLR